MASMPSMIELVTTNYLQPGAYIAIMLAVLGVPQVLSGYFDRRESRLNRQEAEANAERRHQERLDIEARREEGRREEVERREERRREERAEREERREERRRQEAEISERRHQEMMTALIAAIRNGRNHENGQSETIRRLQETVENLEAENARLRQQNGNGHP